MQILQKGYKTLQKSGAGKEVLENLLFNTSSRKFSFDVDKYQQPKSSSRLNITSLNNISLIDKDMLLSKHIGNISSILDYQDPIKDYTVGIALPKCGVEDFYPNGNPSLPDPKTIQNAINEHIKEEVEQRNEEMQNKFVCVMNDKYFNHFHKICNAPAVVDTLIYFDMKPPTEAQTQKVFDLDSKNGNLMFAICDAKEKKIVGCIGARFHNTEMPLKDGTYTTMTVPEIWAKMSEPQKGMSSLLRKTQEALYNHGYEITYARIPCNHLLAWQPHSEKIFKMIPSFKLPIKGGGMDIQTYYGYKDKTKEEVSKEKQHFLNTMCSQILHSSGFIAKENIPEKDVTSNNKGFTK